MQETDTTKILPGVNKSPRQDTENPKIGTISRKNRGLKASLAKNEVVVQTTEMIRRRMNSTSNRGDKSLLRDINKIYSDSKQKRVELDEQSRQYIERSQLRNKRVEKQIALNHQQKQNKIAVKKMKVKRLDKAFAKFNDNNREKARDNKSDLFGNYDYNENYDYVPTDRVGTPVIIPLTTISDMDYKATMFNNSYDNVPFDSGDSTIFKTKLYSLDSLEDDRQQMLEEVLNEEKDRLRTVTEWHRAAQIDLLKEKEEQFDNGEWFSEEFKDLFSEASLSILSTSEILISFIIAFRSASTCMGKLAVINLAVRTYTDKLTLTRNLPMIATCVAKAGQYISKLVSVSIRTLEYAFHLIEECFEYKPTSKQLLESPLMVDSAKLVGEIVATGIMANLGFWSTDFNKWFRESFIVSSKSTYNIITLILSIIQQLIEGGKLFWKSGDFQDFFAISGSNDCYIRLVEIKNRVTTCLEGYLTSEEVRLLADDIFKLSKSLDILSMKIGIGHPHFPHVRRIMDDLKRYKDSINVVIAKGSIRKMPVTYEIFGPPGVGKSQLLYATLKVALQATGITSFEINDIAHIAEADKFDSTVMNHTKAVVIDDVDCYRVDAMKNSTPVISKLIQFANPVPSPATKAEADEKGTVYPMFNVIALTTNSVDLGLFKVFNTVEAGLRRVPIVITVFVPIEYCLSVVNGGDQSTRIDNAKIAASGMTIAQCMLYRLERREYVGENLIRVIKHEGLAEVDDGFGNKLITMETLLKAFYQMAKKDWDRATSYQSDIKDIFNSKVCPICGTLEYRGMVCNCVTYTPTMIVGSISLYTMIVAYIGPIFTFPQYVYLLVLFLFYKVKYKLTLADRGLDILEKLDFYQSALTVIEDSVRHRAYAFLKENAHVLRFVALGITLFGSYKFYRLIASKTNYDPTIKINLNKQIMNIDLPDADDRPPFHYPRIKQGEERKPFEMQKVVHGLDKCEHNTTFNKIVDILYRNCFIIAVGDNFANGCFIYGQLFVTVAHIFPSSFLKKGSNDVLGVKLLNSSTTTSPISLERSFVYFEEGNDIVYILFHTMNPKKSLYPYLRFTDSKNNVPLDKISLYSLSRDNNVIKVDMLELTNGKIVNNTVVLADTVSICNGFAFDGMAPPGSSGSLALFTEGNFTSIIGIQSACSIGQRSSLIQKFLYYKDVNKILDLIDSWIPISTVEQILPSDLLSVPGPYSIYPHLEGGSIEYVGTLRDHRGVKNKSSFRKTCFYSLITKDGLFYYDKNILSEDKYIIPELQPFSIKDKDDVVWVSAKLVGMAQASTTDVVEPSPTLLRVCYEDYMSEIRKIEFPKVGGPLTEEEAINGVPHIKGINKNASTGFGYPGKFKDYMEEITPQRSRYKEKFRNDCKILEKQIFEGKVPAQVVKANVKDEIIKESKQISPRIFMSFPGPFTHISKIWLMPIVMLILMFPNEFEVALGINALGKSWTVLGNDFLQKKYIFDGDYRKFDKRQMRILLLLFMLMLDEIAVKVGYPEYGRIMIRHCCEIMIFFVVEVGGDLFELLRSLPSGCLLTIFINCFVNSMLFRIAWFTKYDLAFRSMNLLRTYGDDCINGTDVFDFNLQYMTVVMGKYGITFTPANKSSDVVLFTPFEEITFLKRHFLPTLLSDGNIYHLCPLAEVSIFKMLAYTDCDLKDEKLVMLTNLIDAHKQYWFYGKEIFLNRKCFLQRLAWEVGLFNSFDNNLPLRWYTYEELEKQYLDGTLQVQFV